MRVRDNVAGKFLMIRNLILGCERRIFLQIFSLVYGPICRVCILVLESITKRR